MEVFLHDILRIGMPVLLIAPPALNRGAWVQDEIRIDESRILSGLYKELTIKLGADFADAGEWAVELSFDGVHFTEAGHKAFAQGLKKHLEEKLYER